MTDYSRSKFYGGDRPEYEVETLRAEVKRLQTLVLLLNKDVAYWVDRCDEAEAK